jgi:hypothetical protein
MSKLLKSLIGFSNYSLKKIKQTVIKLNNRGSVDKYKERKVELLKYAQ